MEAKVHEMVKQKYREVQDAINIKTPPKSASFTDLGQLNSHDINQISTDTFAASHSQKNLVQSAYLMDQYKKLEQRVATADQMVSKLCEVLMSSKGKLFKQLLD